MFRIVCALAVAASCNAAFIQSELEKTLAATGSANIIVSMKGGIQRPLNAMKNRPFASRSIKINSLVQSLEQHAIESQVGVLQMLNRDFSSFKTISFWASNDLYVEEATAEVVDALASMENVGEIYQEKIITLEPIIEEGNVTTTMGGLQWGIKTVKADQVWATGNKGEGIIVGTIDTGVRGTHEILKHNYIGAAANGWYDPYEKTSSPNDGNGHGTHTMGTICGSKGYGVAPGAKWLACKGCSTSRCTQAALLGCGQYILCPHDKDGKNKDCSKAPHISSNSWGGGQNQGWYQKIVDAWRAADIVPVFAQGNSGPKCGTANSPGDYSNVIGVGATTSSNSLASFSSVGPAKNGNMKPDVSAPGHQVNSAWYNSDNGYKTISGTSMACPHTAGVIALMMAVDNNLSYDNMRSYLTATSNTDLVAPNKDCGGVNDATYPNNMFGYGVVDALGAVSSIGGPRPTPRPTGYPTPSPPVYPTPSPSKPTEKCFQNWRGQCLPRSKCRFCFVQCTGC